LNSESVSIFAINWLLTYLLHSSILLGAAWLMTRTLADRFDAIKEMLWKFALVGGVLSATANVCKPDGGFGHLLNLPDRVSLSDSDFFADEPSSSIGAPNGGGIAESSATLLPFESAGADLPLTGLDHRQATPDQAVATSMWTRATERLGDVWRTGAPALAAAVPWAGVLVIGLSGALLLFAIAQLQRLLNGRRLVDDARVAALFEVLRNRAGVSRRIRLTTSARIASPLAMGTLRGEICLPERALRLGDEELTGMLAHELAHVLRRDPLWMLIGHTLSLMLFVQPLNRLAHRRLRELAEYQCDAWAASQCRDGLTLARCLTEVASWMVASNRPAVPELTSGMSVRQSTLSRRVGRLLEHDPQVERSWRHRMLAFVTMGLLAITVVLAPGIAAVEARAQDEVIAQESQVDSPPPGLTEMAEVASSVPPSSPDPREQLSMELARLEADVANLKNIIRTTPFAEEVAPLITQFEDKAASIRARLSRFDNQEPESTPTPTDAGRRSASP
jgi:beta-lactamase regulating signal transducer with metallopeptidase domain